MALNLADSAEIMAAYDAVLNNELNWFLLYYPNNTGLVDELALYAFGSDGLEELKTKIDPSKDEQVFVGFLRADDIVPVEEESEEDSVKYVLISYVPKGVLGVRRARAKVHTRRLGMIFKKHDAVLTVDDCSQLTNTTITHSLAEPEQSLLTFSTSQPGGSAPRPTSPTAGTVIHTASPTGSPTNPQYPQVTATDMGRSISQPQNQPPTSFMMELKPVKRSFSETESPTRGHRYSSTGTSPPSHHKLGSNVFSHFLRRKKRSGSAGGRGDESQESEDSMPPPTPPKDKGIYATMGVLPSLEKKEMTYDEPGSFPPVLPTISETSFGRSRSVSEFAVVSHDETDMVVIRPEEFDLYGEKKARRPGQQQKRGIEVLRKGKWAEPEGLSAIRDPGERARARMEMQRQKEEEQKGILRAEEERQARVRREKEEFLRREEEEGERRKAAIHAEAVRVGAERRRREEAEREEEERKRREREERKRSDRERRMEEHLRREEWRQAQQRIAEETTRAEEEAKKREEDERRAKISRAENAVKREGGMAGWVSIQTDDSVVWRRRYYRFVQNTCYFYRSAKDLAQAVDRVDVRRAVAGVKEPQEGYEALGAIPHSFAVEFTDGAVWSMYADSERDKFQLLALLQYARR